MAPHLVDITHRRAAVPSGRSGPARGPARLTRAVPQDASPVRSAEAQDVRRVGAAARSEVGVSVAGWVYLGVFVAWCVLGMLLVLTRDQQ
jgi:hypothetical protein